MTPRQTNLTLLWLIVLAILSGAAAFAVGTRSGWFVVITHGILGLALVVMTPWKTPIVRRGLPRPRAGRALSIGLTLSTLAALLTGVVQTMGVTDRIGPLTTMQAHVGTGVVALVMVLIHAVQRPVRRRVVDQDRRGVLRAGGIIAGAGLLYLGLEGVWRATRLPGGDRRFTGSHLISDIANVPYTQWLNDRVQHLPEGHRVDIAGSVHTLAELVGDDEVTATLDCTGGWHTRQTWSGTRLDRLVDITAGRSLVVRSVTGYWRRFPLEQAGDLLLATHVGGEPLRDGHGGPVRVVAPGRRGFWWVKWVSSIEVDDLPSWWQPPLPLA